MLDAPPIIDCEKLLGLAYTRYCIPAPIDGKVYPHIGYYCGQYPDKCVIPKNELYPSNCDYNINSGKMECK